MAKVKRKTIGDNPLDAVVPNIAEASNDNNEVPQQKFESVRIKKERITIQLPVNLINQLRNAVFWTPGLTLAKFTETALNKSLTELENKRGEPFPERTEELAGGRPLKT